MEEIKNYKECLNKLFTLHGIRMGVDNSRKLSEAFGSPCDKYKTVHVSGTNGKGSVCYKIYTCLKLKKYKVGIYTSPHIFSLRERIMVNDELISEEDIIFLVNEILKKSKKLNINPTFFEILTLVAYLHFSNKNVDYAIIETGLGGKLDATNILNNPEVIVITSIGYDHEAILGNELSLICDEKIGIFKKNANVVIGPSVSIYKNVFKKAKELNCNIKAITPEPRGETYNEENSRIVLEVLKFLNINVDNFLKHVIKIKPPLRLQYLAQEQIYHFKKKIISNHLKGNNYLYPYAVILDAGHNITAIDRLCRDINCFHKDKLIRVCIALSKPRNLDIFNPFVAHFPDTLKDVYYLPSINPRAYDFETAMNMTKKNDKIDEKLKQIIFESSKKVNTWLEYNNKENKDYIENVDISSKRGITPLIMKNAFLECCKDNSILLITGTFYIFDEVLNAFDIHYKAKDEIYMNEPGID